MKNFFLFSLTFSSVLLAETVSLVDFENRSEGVYTNNFAKEDFKRNSTDNSWWYAMDKNNGENSKIVYDGETHGMVLQLKYPKGCVGPGGNESIGAPACAGQIIQPLVKTSDTMWVAYDLFFEDGFEFRLGGKLPGLCGGKCYTGNAKPSTGDGWSARMMWREDGDIVQLMYFMDQISVYGDDFLWNLGGSITQKRFSTGKWHRVVTKVSMNDVLTEGNGEKNGRVQSWFDGELAMDVDTLRLRDYDTLKVDKFYLSTFHGGSSAEWAPTQDCYIRYDNIMVSTDSIPVSYASLEQGNGGMSQDSSLAISFLNSQNFVAKGFKLVSGQHFLLNQALEKDTYVSIFNLKGELLQQKVYPIGTSAIPLPSQEQVYMIKIHD